MSGFIAARTFVSNNILVFNDCCEKYEMEETRTSVELSGAKAYLNKNALGNSEARVSFIVVISRGPGFKSRLKSRLRFVFIVF